MSAQNIGERYHVIRARLHELYPAAFCARGERPVPLKIGIHTDIIADPAHGFGKGRVRWFLKTWARRPEYLEAVILGGPRYALDGSQVGEVKPEQSAHASAWLKTKQARQAQKEAA